MAFTVDLLLLLLCGSLVASGPYCTQFRTVMQVMQVTRLRSCCCSHYEWFGIVLNFSECYCQSSPSSPARQRSPLGKPPRDSRKRWPG